VPGIAHHRLEATAQAPQRARSLLETGLADFATLEERESAQLLISELVTNALRHTDSEVILIDVGVDGCIRVGVTDESPRLPQRRLTRHNDEEGRGLMIVEALAERWGIDPLAGNGKRIWFELRGNDSSTDRSLGSAG
jgi:anti-sigma regulatory factor (Ser/Thr protein kinase)